MPKFAANLSMLFTELPFLERFAAAARAGFEAVEFLFPYEYAAGEIRQHLQENQLQLVLFNDPTRRRQRRRMGARRHSREKRGGPTRY